MFQLTDLINAQDTIGEVVSRYPSTRDVFEANGFWHACWNMPIRTAAWREGIELSGLLDELNRAASLREVKQ